MCSNFYEIWHLAQIKLIVNVDYDYDYNADYEYSTWNGWSRPKIIDSGKFSTLNFDPIFIEFRTHNKSTMLIMNIILASV